MTVDLQTQREGCRLLFSVCRRSYDHLVRYSTVRHRRAKQYGIDPRDIVHDAVLACLDGSRRWPNDKVMFFGFMLGSVSSRHSSYTKHGVRAGAGNRQLPSKSVPTPEELFEAAEDYAVLNETIARIADEPDLRAFWLSVERGNVKRCNVKRCNITKDLDWSPKRTSATRIKLQRRLRKVLP